MAAGRKPLACLCHPPSRSLCCSLPQPPTSCSCGVAFSPSCPPFFTGASFFAGGGAFQGVLIFQRVLVLLSAHDLPPSSGSFCHAYTDSSTPAWHRLFVLDPGMASHGSLVQFLPGTRWLRIEDSSDTLTCLGISQAQQASVLPPLNCRTLHKSPDTPE